MTVIKNCFFRSKKTQLLQLDFDKSTARWFLHGLGEKKKRNYCHVLHHMVRKSAIFSRTSTSGKRKRDRQLHRVILKIYMIY